MKKVSCPKLPPNSATGDNNLVPLGVYLSVPFCRTKCTYCNFASDVFSKAVFGKYVDRVCADIENAKPAFEELGGEFDPEVDTVYFGGGTPTVLYPADLERIFHTIRSHFTIHSDAEITVECAPGTLSPAVIASLLGCGVNRVSLGLQSFSDREAAAIGRLHKRETVLADIANLRSANISNINLDLIAGLPHQTVDSWRFSVEEVIATGVPHVSVYMLEVDEDSRLGRELIAGGTKYHAHFVPDEDLTADLYGIACERLHGAGIEQYEISNFARAGFQSRHNLKYWTRQPYIGFGVDAHSMLRSIDPQVDAIRFATPDSLEQFTAGKAGTKTVVDRQAALEESFFLGLRLTKGINLEHLRERFGPFVVTSLSRQLVDLATLELVTWKNNEVCLTPKGRLLSNEVFEQFISSGSVLTPP